MVQGHAAPAAPLGGLGASARASILWGGGFTLLRDVAQFGVMLILVRLLTPADYGAAALAQAVVGVVSAISYQTFSTHALQIRNPDDIDWQAHFTAAAVLNVVLAGLVLVLAFGLSFAERWREAAPPLAALSVVFLIEIPGALRHRMLEANHDWKRFRVLLIIGTFLGLAVGLGLGLMGAGVWALILQIPMLGLPAAIDLFWTARFKPDWTWSWARYRDTTLFGFNRLGANLAARLRQLVENGMMAAAFDLATLGVYSRAMVLANLLVGRVGGVVMSSLYPVVTRAERGSERFQRLAGLVLRGVAWLMVPAAAFLAIAAADVVALLYGARWSQVTPLLALATASFVLVGIASTLSSLLMANDDVRASSALDIATAPSGIGLALWLMPMGARTYLLGLCALGSVVIAASILLLVQHRAMSARDLVAAFVPALVSAAIALAAVLAVRHALGVSAWLPLRLAVDGALLGLAYLVVLRIAFTSALAELTAVLPGASRAQRLLRLPAP